MPDLDFIGFSNAQIDDLIIKMTPVLTSLPFANDIVIIRDINENRKVIQLSGHELPFLRIYTRCQERAKILTEALKSFCDIEIIYIGLFTPKIS